MKTLARPLFFWAITTRGSKKVLKLRYTWTFPGLSHCDTASQEPSTATLEVLNVILTTSFLKRAKGELWIKGSLFAGFYKSICIMYATHACWSPLNFKACSRSVSLCLDSHLRSDRVSVVTSSLVISTRKWCNIIDLFFFFFCLPLARCR
jgi:hypothetical protein